MATFYKQITLTGSAGGESISQAIVLDGYIQGPVLLNCAVSGTVTYTVQHSFDNAGTINLNTGGSWNNHNVSTLVSATTTQDGNYLGPPQAVRVRLFAGSIGTLKFTVSQPGTC